MLRSYGRTAWFTDCVKGATVTFANAVSKLIKFCNDSPKHDSISSAISPGEDIEL